MQVLITHVATRLDQYKDSGAINSDDEKENPAKSLSYLAFYGNRFKKEKLHQFSMKNGKILGVSNHTL